jgi:hypothetical protein
MDDERLVGVHSDVEYSSVEWIRVRQTQMTWLLLKLHDHVAIGDRWWSLMLDLQDEPMQLLVAHSEVAEVQWWQMPQEQYCI